VDSRYCHANWAVDLGGISYPLLADFHPKGAVAQTFGVYLAHEGFTDRATVIIDRHGIVRYTDTVTPAGRRDIDELLELAKEIASKDTGELPPAPERPSMSKDATLYVREGCGFCRSVLRAMTNLHCDQHLRVRDVTKDPEARKELDRLAGAGAKVPVLVQGGEVLTESADIVKALARCYARA
jgi:glutaredoxin